VKRSPIKRNTEMKRGGPMKRSPMKRGDSQLQRSSMKRTGGPDRSGELKRTPMKQRSTKRAEFMREDRVPRIEAMVKDGRGCEIGPELSRLGVRLVRRHCKGGIEGLHERRKRSAGGSLTNDDNLVPACNYCNGWIEDNPDTVRELTGTQFVVREGDDEYEALGKRADGMSEEDDTVES
jgi:hypothetical protein